MTQHAGVNALLQPLLPLLFPPLPPPLFPHGLPKAHGAIHMPRRLAGALKQQGRMITCR
jgi:hypothetical protein